MAGLMYIPQRQNQMFSVLSNLIFQKMAHKQRMEIADKQIAARTVIDRQEAERAKLMLDERRLHEEQQTEKANKRQDEKDVKKAKSKLITAGYTPAGTATTTPTAAGMNTGQSDIIQAPVAGGLWRKPPEDEWGPKQVMKLDGKDVAVQVNKKDNRIRPILGKPTTAISLGEKLVQHREKAAISGDVKIKNMIASPKFKASVVDNLKKQYGDNWNYQEPYMQEEMIVREMDRQIKAAHPDRAIVFDEKKGGWIDIKTGKIIKKYKLSKRDEGNQQLPDEIGPAGNTILRFKVPRRPK